MKPLLFTENVPEPCLPGTAFVPVRVANETQFARDALAGASAGASLQNFAVMPSSS
jgi:hypothetical protein